MELDETIKRILSDISTNEDDILTTQHYIPTRFFKYYLSLAYTAGYDERGKYKYHKTPIIRIKGNDIKRYNSQTEAAKDMEIDKSNINKVLKKKRKTINGYRFEYI